MRTNHAIVTGIRGQDGIYLARRLSSLGMTVTGTSRRADVLSPNLELLIQDGSVSVVPWDGTKQCEFSELLRQEQPKYVFNLAALSAGSTMFDDPVSIAEVNGLSVVRILEAIRSTDPNIRFCQASSSELFGNTTIAPQCEQSLMNPRSPYGAAKLYAHSMVRIYREKHGLFLSSAILYNHESPLRELGFVSRKITHAAASIRQGHADNLSLGSLDSLRDWGFAGDFVEAMRLMLVVDEPDDFVIATGRLHSVRQLCECAFSHVNLDYRRFVREDHTLQRAAELIPLVGNAQKARERLAWKPSVEFAEMISLMVDADMALLSRK